MTQFTLTDLIVVLFLGLVAGYFVVSFFLPERVRKNLRRRSRRISINEQFRSSESARSGKAQQDERADSKSRPEPDAPMSERECAIVLGLRGRVTLHQIKTAYRNEIAKYHPDKVNHLAPEFRDLAQARTRRIRSAYEHFRHKYDL